MLTLLLTFLDLIALLSLFSLSRFSLVLLNVSLKYCASSARPLTSPCKGRSNIVNLFLQALTSTSFISIKWAWRHDACFTLSKTLVNNCLFTTFIWKDNKYIIYLTHTWPILTKTIINRPVWPTNYQALWQKRKKTFKNSLQQTVPLSRCYLQLLYKHYTLINNQEDNKLKHLWSFALILN